MKYDRLWERLLEHVASWADIREVPGGLEVTFEGATGVPRTVEVVVTSAQWDDYISVIYGTGDPRATPLREKLLAMPEEMHCLVYDTYDWQPSRTRVLPEVDVDPGPGEWGVTDESGRVIHRFADFPDED